MIAVRVLEATGTLLFLVSLVLAVKKQCSESDRPVLFKVAARLECLAGLMTLVGVAIFGILKEGQTYSNGVANAENYTFHAGFYLAIAAGVLSIVAAITLNVDRQVADHRQEKTQEKERTAVSESSQERVFGHHGYNATMI